MRGSRRGDVGRNVEKDEFGQSRRGDVRGSRRGDVGRNVEKDLSFFSSLGSLGEGT